MANRSRPGLFRATGFDRGAVAEPAALRNPCFALATRTRGATRPTSAEQIARVKARGDLKTITSKRLAS